MTYDELLKENGTPIRIQGRRISPIREIVGGRISGLAGKFTSVVTDYGPIVRRHALAEDPEFMGVDGERLRLSSVCDLTYFDW